MQEFAISAIPAFGEFAYSEIVNHTIATMLNVAYQAVKI